MKSERFNTIGSVVSSVQQQSGPAGLTENEILQRKLKTISKDIKFLVSNEAIMKKVQLHKDRKDKELKTKDLVNERHTSINTGSFSTIVNQNNTRPSNVGFKKGGHNSSVEISNNFSTYQPNHRISQRLT